MSHFAIAVTVAMATSSLLLLLLPPATQVTALPRPYRNRYAPSNPSARPWSPYSRPTPNVRPNPWVRPPNYYIPPNPIIPPSNPIPSVHPNPTPTPSILPPKKPNNLKPIVRTIIKKAIKHYLKDMAKQGMRNVSSSTSSSSVPQQQQWNQLGGDAADNGAAALFLGLFVGSGTSQQFLYGVIDITSELVWVQCGYCPSCNRLLGTRTIQLGASPSFFSVGCATTSCERVSNGDPANCVAAAGGNYCVYEEVFYGGDQYTSGFLATETFTFGAMVRVVAFGCSGNVMVRGLADAGGASGFLGFSRGPLSLVAQLQLYGFSYFISSGDDGRESFFTFLDAPTQQLTNTRYTPLIKATAKQNPDLYYVNLTGVQVDGELLPATFDGDGGVYLSTTLPVTYLEEAAYSVLKQEFVGRIQSQGVAPVSVEHDPLCYMTRSLESIQVPQLALVFHGPDATMDLGTENYFLPVDGGQTCLAILPSIGGSVLGSLVQAGRNITYSGIQGGGGWLSFN